MPKVNTSATTPDGEGIVLNNDILRREVTVRFTTPEGDIEVQKYPLESINAKVKQNAEEIKEEDLKLEEEK
jgi:hypothetical protein